MNGRDPELHALVTLLAEDILPLAGPALRGKADLSAFLAALDETADAGPDEVRPPPPALRHLPAALAAQIPRSVQALTSTLS